VKLIQSLDHTFDRTKNTLYISLVLCIARSVWSGNSLEHVNARDGKMGRMLKLFIILPCLITMFQPLNAKVEAPNYDFSVSTLEDFFPGKDVSEIEKKYGTAEVMSEAGNVKTLKFYVAQIRYKFPVLVQVENGIVNDVFARLPNYFLHDVFFQSLVNRFGKQTTYKKVLEEAYYVWDQKPLKHVYSAACTITCFPIFYSVQKSEGLTPLLEKMKKN
jgi:hypothetical protein